MSPIILRFLIVSLYFTFQITFISSICRGFCGNAAVRYPFGIDDGCGSPEFKGMMNCSNSTDLFFQTPSGNYKVQTIDYEKQTMVIYDPTMSTCSILQPHHDFVMSETQNAVITPTQDTVFALVNCSIDSPVLNRYSSLCFNFSGHTCDELYGSCNAFRVFHLYTNSSPPCCFTSYSTMKFMNMNILDCSHYTTVFNTDSLKGIGPLDWLYGIKLSFAVPDTGCQQCFKSGGSCGYNVETEGSLCICNATVNSTRQCALAGVAADSAMATGWSQSPKHVYHMLLILYLASVTLLSIFF
ncbi:uncharacterized protein LOC124912824 [Impatiens glandulifera]|uniref:uncharacterized protein LOC124912824 n=1 Tax=Impatiens glandulifera TaxID=253017 RepID=UPI001FB19637|nr:uncharacterized protein LOC124912824 [Impatiens glandulifera]